MLKEIIYSIYIERMTTELELFTASLNDRNLSSSTTHTYIKLYNKLYTKVDGDLHNISQNKILEILEDMNIKSINSFN